jgi:PAS domain S-box-containing protein
MQEPSQLMELVLQPVCADARACAATLRRLRETGYQLAPLVKFEELPQQCRHSAPACIIAILRRDSELAPAFAALQECHPVPFVLVFPEALAEAVAETFQPLPPAGVLFEPLRTARVRPVLRLALARAAQLQQAVERSEWLWDVLSSIGDAVIVTDTQGRIHFLNASAEALTGWGRTEALGRPIQEVFTIFNEETGAPVEAPIARVLREGHVVGLANHTVLRRRDGTEITIDDSGAPIRDAAGNLLGAVLVFRDVTPLRRLQRAQARSLQLRTQLLELLQLLLQAPSMEELLSNSVELLNQLLPLDLAALYELDEEQALLLPRWYTAGQGELRHLPESPIPLHRSLLGAILSAGAPQCVNNAHLDPRTYYPEGFRPPQEHLIGIPLQLGARRAILAIARFSAQPFEEEEFEVAQLWAHFTGIGLARLELIEHLRRSQELYRQLLDWLPYPVLVHRQGQVLYVNRATVEYLGASSAAELLGSPVLEVVAPESRQQALERISKLYSGEWSSAPPVVTILQRRDGSKLQAVVTALRVEFEGAPAVLVTGVDLTELQQAQERLQQERNAFRLLAQTVLEAGSLQEFAERFLASAARELGFEGGSLRPLREGMLVPIAVGGEWARELFPAVPVESPGFLSAHVARTRAPLFIEDVRTAQLPSELHHRLEQLGVAAVLGAPIFGSEYQLLGTFQLWHRQPVRLDAAAREYFSLLGLLLGAALERFLALDQLQERERHLRALVEAAPIAITEFDLRQRCYILANREFERQSGYTLAEFEALSDEELIAMIHPDDRQRIFSFWRRWEQEGFPGVQRIAYRIFNRSGETVWLDTYLYAHRAPDGTVRSIIQLCADITALKRAEQELQRALQEDFRRTVQALNAVVFRLQHRPDGSVVYTLREGTLAGEHTTARIADTPMESLPESLRLPEEALHRAFAGESVELELPTEEGWRLYTLQPVTAADGSIEVVGTGVDISRRKQLELELAESRERYRTLLEALPAAVLEFFVSDEDRTQDLYVNPAFTAMTGLTLEELSHIPPEGIIAPEDREEVLQRWREWLRQPDAPPLHLQYRALRKNGEIYWLDLHAVKLRVHNGWRVAEVGLDITAQRQAEERIRHLASFPELAPVAIMELSPEGELLYANPEARHLLPSDAPAREHPLLEDLPALLEQLRTQGLLVRQASFQERTFLEHIHWVAQNNTVRVYLSDITLLQLLQQQLQEAIQHERELASVRARLMSALAHEFRTPLAGIQISAELLQRYFERLTPQERQHELQNILQRVQDLNVLLTDFLTQSTLDALRRQLELHPIPLQQLCQEVAGRIEPLLQSKQQRLEMELPPEPILVRADARSLRFVLLNLLTNAAKYSSAGQPIHLRLRRELGTAVVEVEDHGIGIPPEELTRVLEPFYRASNALGTPGVGLGLSMAKEFVELHRGTLELRSQLGVGTTATVRFPLVEPEAELMG